MGNERSPCWAREERSAVGESDQAFAWYIARHIGVPARKKDDATVILFRDVLGIETAPAPEPRRVA